MSIFNRISTSSFVNKDLISYLTGNVIFNQLIRFYKAISLRIYRFGNILRYLQALKKRWLTYSPLFLASTLKAFSINKKSNNSLSKTSRGFTLPELIVTVCVLAILAVIATPPIIKQLTRMEAKRIRYALTTAIATAKAESYIRRQNLIVCLADLQGRCNKNNDKAILLFFDINDNKNFDENVDELLDKQRLAPRYSRLQLRAGNRHYIKFWGDSGKPRGFFGHIKYCPTSSYNQSMYQISFNQVGIVKYKPSQAHPTGC